MKLRIRAETKQDEKRTPVTPQAVKKLIEHGYEVEVERSAQRVYADVEYAEAGATLVAENSWPTCDASTVVIGLKELAPELYGGKLVHTHISFGHCFKGQDGWADVMGAYVAGNGTLLDLEFLTEGGRRVATFGPQAGMGGAALGLHAYAASFSGSCLTGPIVPAESFSALAAAAGAAIAGLPRPRVLVVGALGRVGRGAVELLRAAGLEDAEMTLWDMEETKVGGPFETIVRDHDIFVNCILLSEKMPPFITPEMVASEPRRLRVIVDISCDYTSPFNPLPIYSQATTFREPIVRVHRGAVTDLPPLDVCSIDHLPSIIPRESSESFCNDLLPHLLALADNADIWVRARAVFDDVRKKL